MAASHFQVTKKRNAHPKFEKKGQQKTKQPSNNQRQKIRKVKTGYQDKE